MRNYEFRVYDIERDDWDGDGELPEAISNPDSYEVKLEYSCDDRGVIDCAYVQDGKLPERMRDGKKIPKKYHELIKKLSPNTQ